MAHADAIRVNQSLIHQSQLLFGYGKQRCQSPICQATPNDVRLRSILWKQRALMAYQFYINKSNFLKYSVSLANTGDGVVLS